MAPIGWMTSSLGEVPFSCRALVVALVVFGSKQERNAQAQGEGGYLMPFKCAFKRSSDQQFLSEGRLLTHL